MIESLCLNSIHFIINNSFNAFKEALTDCQWSHSHDGVVIEISIHFGHSQHFMTFPAFNTQCRHLYMLLDKSVLRSCLQWQKPIHFVSLKKWGGQATRNRLFLDDPYVKYKYHWNTLSATFRLVSHNLMTVCLQVSSSKCYFSKVCARKLLSNGWKPTSEFSYTIICLKMWLCASRPGDTVSLQATCLLKQTYTCTTQREFR